MSNSIVLCHSLAWCKNSSSSSSFSSHTSASAVVRLSSVRKKSRGLVANAKKKYSKRKKSWWQRFFFDEDGNWLGLKDEDMIDVLESEESSDDEVSDYEKFEAWKRRAEAIVELREAQEDVKNEESRRWEDWLVDGTSNDAGNGASWIDYSNDAVGKPGNDVGEDLTDMFSGRGLVKSVRDIVLGREDDDILYEDRVFRYASVNSAKFLAVLIIVPWAMNFLVHDYVLMPFLDRYVKTVPLAAEILDVRRSQKKEMIKVLNLEKARYRLEVEIGKSPPLSDEDLFLVIRQKAIALRDERRLENRKEFANIWSDIVFGVSLFALLYLFQNQVALLKFTGYKILNNISDTGKAFLIILITDIFLGVYYTTIQWTIFTWPLCPRKRPSQLRYHSESGWQTLLEVIVEHYGLEVDQAAITIFICFVPVVIDACVKLWLFKYLPKLSTKVSNIFQEMKRH